MIKIEEIDKNFKVETINSKDIVFINAKNDVFDIYGLYKPREKDTPFRRLPRLDGVYWGVNMLASNTAGGKIRFKTNSPYIALRVEFEDVCHMSHMTLAGSCGFDLYSFDEKEEHFIGPLLPPECICHGELSFQCFKDLKAKEDRYLTLYLPLYNGVKSLEIGIAPDAYLDKGAPFMTDCPVVYYGSSITQGGCASRPGNAYPALITHKTNIDHTNLGFSGSACGEISMAEYIAGLDMCAFVYDYDYNAESPEYLRKTHEPFFKKIRNAHPCLPIIMLSAPYYAKDGDDRTRRDIIKETYLNAKESGDENVYFIDGGDLFNGDFPEACTVDGAHPNDLGFTRMSQGILPILIKALKL